MLDNVAYGLKVRGESKQMCAERALHWINTVGLKGYENKYPHQLSGGMRQRVGLARALAADTDIILMDEAFSALDPLIRAEMQDQLLELQKTLHKTIVFITHDLDEAVRIGNRIAILKDGRLIQVGTPTRDSAFAGGWVCRPFCSAAGCGGLRVNAGEIAFVARELAPVRARSGRGFFGAASQPSGSKLPRHRIHWLTELV